MKIIRIELCLKCLFIFFFLSISRHSIAQTEADEWEVDLGVSVFADSNLFRQDSGQQVDDTVTTSFVSFNTHQYVSRQEFEVSAKFGDNRYDVNDYLDYPSKDINVNWHWLATSRLSGGFSAAYTEVINDFVDYSYVDKNIRTKTSYYSSAQWWAIGPLYFVVDMGHYKQENSEEFSADGDYRSNTLNYGVKFQSRAGSSISILHSYVKGKSDEDSSNDANKIDAGFDEKGGLLRFFWAPSGKLNLRGRVGYSERTHDTYNERDFQGGNGRVDVNWFPTGKMQLTATLGSELHSFQSSTVSDINLYFNNLAFYNSSYYRKDFIVISADWSASFKSSFALRGRKEKRDFRGGLAELLPERVDEIDSITLVYSWEALDWLAASMTAQHSQRISNLDRAEFRDNLVGVNLRLRFF